jgi:hypothetical protein
MASFMGLGPVACAWRVRGCILVGVCRSNDLWLIDLEDERRHDEITFIVGLQRVVFGVAVPDDWS